MPYVSEHATRVAGYVSVSALLGESSPRELEVPALLIWGELDSPNSSKARDTAAAFTRSQKVVLPDAPHPCYLKEPQLFNELLLEFVTGAAVAGNTKRLQPGIRAEWAPSQH